MFVHLILTPFISGTVIADIAKSRAEIEAARLLVYSAALQIDKVKAKGAAKEIGIAKVSICFEQSVRYSGVLYSLLFHLWPAKWSTVLSKRMGPRVLARIRPSPQCTLACVAFGSLMYVVYFSITM